MIDALFKSTLRLSCRYGNVNIKPVPRMLTILCISRVKKNFDVWQRFNQSTPSPLNVMCMCIQPITHP